MLVVAVLTIVVSGCATRAAMQAGRTAEQLQDYDRAVAEYTKVVHARPGDRDARLALERARLRAAQAHFARARRLAELGRYEETLIEYQLAVDLNPTSAAMADAVRDTRALLQTTLAARTEGQTALEALIESTRDLAPLGLELPEGEPLPESLVFRDARSRDVFAALGQFAGVTMAFDPAFQDAPLSIDLRGASLEEALESVAQSTGSFVRVTSPGTITIIPDIPAKRREYEQEVVRTFYLSNADVTETIDMLRVVMDLRRVAPMTATNAITVKDTPERIAAAARVLQAIDKARAEVVIDVELLEVDRTRLKEYGLQIASPASIGIEGEIDVNRQNLTLSDLSSLTTSEVFVTNLPRLLYRLLKSDANTRTLANPHLRTSEGLSAQARFGERVPVPVTTFAPFATGGVAQQPITSFNYENIGVNIDITPRIHHDAEVSLALQIEVSNISGTGFGNLPTFGNRFINTTIRLKDGETNLLAGLIRDDERVVLEGIPGLSDLPVIGRLFARNHRESQETDIILTLTPHIIRSLDLSESDLRAFLVERDTSTALPTGPATIAAPQPRSPAANELVPPAIRPLVPPPPC